MIAKTKRTLFELEELRDNQTQSSVWALFQCECSLHFSTFLFPLVLGMMKRMERETQQNTNKKKHHTQLIEHFDLVFGFSKSQFETKTTDQFHVLSRNVFYLVYPYVY